MGLYPDDMTKDEVRAEFARLFVKMNAEEYERRLKKKREGRMNTMSLSERKSIKDGVENHSDMPRISKINEE